MELEAEFDRLQLRTSDSQDETKQPGEADLALLCLCQGHSTHDAPSELKTRKSS